MMYYRYKLSAWTRTKGQVDMTYVLSAWVNKQEFGGDEIFDMDGYASQETSWNKMDEDMLVFSKSHPDLVISVDEEGDFPDDAVRYFFHNGKSYRSPLYKRLEPRFVHKKLEEVV